MQKNIFLFMFIITVVLAITFQGFSAETGSSTKNKSSTQSTSEVSAASGSVTAVNLKDSTLTLSTKTGSTLIVAIGKSTTIYKKGNGISIKDIKKGDSVKVSYEKKVNKNIARSINVEEGYATYPIKSKSR